MDASMLEYTLMGIVITIISELIVRWGGRFLINWWKRSQQKAEKEYQEKLAEVERSRNRTTEEKEIAFLRYKEDHLRYHEAILRRDFEEIITPYLKNPQGFVINELIEIVRLILLCAPMFVLMILGFLLLYWTHVFIALIPCVFVIYSLGKQVKWTIFLLHNLMVLIKITKGEYGDPPTLENAMKLKEERLSKADKTQN